MLDLHKISINQSDLSYIKTTYEKRGGFLNYKDVLKLIQINLDVVDPLNSQWLV